MNSKRDYEVTLLERDGKIEEAIATYEKAGLFEVAAMHAESIGRIKRAIQDYEKAGDFGLSCELEHGRNNDRYTKEIEEGGVNKVLRDIKKYEERARTGYYDGELEWGPEMWRREANTLKEGLRRLK